MRVDVKYAITLISLFVGSYLLHQFMIGITAPGGGYYSPFADQYLNYIKWLRNLQLGLAEKLGNLFQQPVYRKDAFILTYKEGRGVALVYGCIGVEVMCLWVIYVVLSPLERIKKWCYSLIGVVLIVTSNVIRIVVLLYYANQTKEERFAVDHHLAYNTVLYVLVIIMMLYLNSIMKKKFIE